MDGREGSHAEWVLRPRVPQVGGAAVMAVGVWTLVEKSGYLGVLASSTFAASAYILIFAGALVMVTGFLGFGAVIREDRGCLSAVSACPPAGRRGPPARGLRPPVSPLTPRPGSVLRAPLGDTGPGSEACRGQAGEGWAAMGRLFATVSRFLLGPKPGGHLAGGGKAAPSPPSRLLLFFLCPGFIMAIFKHRLK